MRSTTATRRAQAKPGFETCMSSKPRPGGLYRVRLDTEVILFSPRSRTTARGDVVCLGPGAVVLYLGIDYDAEHYCLFRFLHKDKTYMTYNENNCSSLSLEEIV